MDMPLLRAALAIFLFYGFWRILSSGADLHFAPFCCIFVEMSDLIKGRPAWAALLFAVSFVLREGRDAGANETG